MARQIAAHITLIYPEELRPDAELEQHAELEQLAAAGAAATASFRIALGPAFYAGSPANGVFLRVHDLEAGLARFRAAAIPAGRMIDFPPHVTIVHPRTSDRGRQAWDELAGTRVDARFTVTHVALTADAGQHWQTLRLIPLTGPAG